MKELVATIHFIGLALFSTQVPESPGLHVLLPRVAAHQHSTAVVTTETVDGTTSGDIAPDESGAIEPHEVYVIYDRKDFVEEIGWTSADAPAHLLRSGLDSAPQYRYVKLATGERVAFLASSANPATTNVTLPLPRPKCSSAIAGTANAVTVAVPRGKLSYCGARFDGEIRYDTKLQISNPSQLVITATVDSSVSKALTLKGNARVYIANVPAAMLGAETWTASGNSEHFRAYYDLVKTSCPEQGLTPPGRTLDTACAADALWLTGDGPVTRSSYKTASAGQAVVDSACSNSAWP